MERWTKKEDIVLIKAVSDFPENLARAFRAASALLDRTPNSCASRWKRVRRHLKETGYVMVNYTPKKKKAKQLDIPFVEKASWWCRFKILIKTWFKHTFKHD